MIPIKDLLNKIKWDKREKAEDYILFYYDRLEEKLRELKLTEVLKIEEGFLVLMREGEEVNIPLHRIKKVKKRGEIIWER